MCLQGLDEVRLFNRFKTVHPGWGYAATCINAITWRPNKTILVAGFGVYGPTTGQASFCVKYRYSVGNDMCADIDIEALSSEVDEKTKIYPLMFEANLVEVPAGTDFTVAMNMFGPG